MESKYKLKETRHATLETVGRESAKRGGVGKLDSTSSLCLDKDQRGAQEVREVRLYSCWSAARSADVSAACSVAVSDQGTACLCGSGLLAPWHRMAKVACSLPTFECSCVARKRKISTLSDFVQPLKLVHSPVKF